MSVSDGRPAQTEPHRSLGQFPAHPHGRQNVRGLDLAGGAGGARRYRDTVEIEANHGGFGPEAGNREQGGIGQPCNIPRKRRSFRASASARLEPIPQALQAGGIVLPGPPWRPRRRRRTPQSRDILGSGPASQFLAAAAQQRLEPLHAVRQNHGADALGAADLVRRKRQQIGPGRARSNGIFPNAWIASTCSSPPAAWTMSATSATGWMRAGLVVGQHHRDQRRRPVGKQRAQMIEIDQAGARDVDGLDRLRRKPPAREHRGVLDRRDQQPLHRHPAPRRRPGVSASALASVPPEQNTTSCGRAPTAAAIAALASSTRRRACRPSA